jgi:hypothetical protein
MTRRTCDPVAAARAAVGWYGDPTVPWSVLLQARLAEPVDAGAVAERLRRLVLRFPHLGSAPVVACHDAAGWPAVCAAFADKPYPDGGALLRAAVGGGEHGERLLVAAHYGATDGLGLLAVLAAALDADLVSRARGIADRPSRLPFLASAARRLAEAVFAPPARIAPAGAGTGDVLAAAELPATSIGSAALTAAVDRAAREWNARHGTPYRRAVAGLGVSRRDGVRATPIADSAFLRLRLPPSAGEVTIRRLIARQAPEPDFPPSRSSLPALVTRPLASRLGATFLASNLGLVRAPALVRSLTFHPAASGRSGVAVGAATVGDTTTITLRARRGAFDDDAATALLAAVVAHLTPAAPTGTACAR